MTDSNVSSIVPSLRARQDVAAAIRAHLAIRGVKDAELAREVGWSQSYMSRRTNAGISFSVDDLGVIAQHFNVTIADLVQPPKERPIGGGTALQGVGTRIHRIVGRTGLEPVTDGSWVAPVTPLFASVTA